MGLTLGFCGWLARFSLVVWLGFANYTGFVRQCFLLGQAERYCLDSVIVVCLVLLVCVLHCIVPWLSPVPPFRLFRWG